MVDFGMGVASAIFAVVEPANAIDNKVMKKK